MWCLVQLPNNTTLGVQCEPKAIGQECLEKVRLNLLEGFEYIMMEQISNKAGLISLLMCDDCTLQFEGSVTNSCYSN